MKMFVGRILILGVILGVWQFVSVNYLPPYLLSTPSKIFATFWQWLIDGKLLYHGSITAIEALLGFIMGALAGMTCGIILGRARKLADLLNPFIVAFYSIPKVALAPLFIIWFGIGIEMKIALTATIVFFLVFLNTFTGVRNVSPELVSILRLMRANERHVMFKVIIPSAVVWVFTGLRLSVPYAMIGAIVAEMMAANRGLGYLLSHSSAMFDTAGVFAALVAIVGMSAVLNFGVNVLARAVTPWEAASAKREVTI